MSLSLSGDGVVTGLDSAASSDLGAELAAKLDSTAYQPGLVLITSESFSAVSSISVNGCFSNTYANYKILYKFTAASAANAQVNIRMRASGSDNTTSNYDVVRIVAAVGTLNVGTSEGQSAMLQVGNIDSTHPTAASGSIDIFGPFISAQTTLVAQTTSKDNSGFSYYIPASGFQRQASSFDGFTLYPNSGTFSGAIRIYGYRN